MSKPGRVKVKLELEIECSERDILKVGGWRNVFRAGREFGERVAAHAVAEITAGALDPVELRYENASAELRPEEERPADGAACQCCGAQPGEPCNPEAHQQAWERRSDL